MQLFLTSLSVHFRLYRGETSNKTALYVRGFAFGGLGFDNTDFTWAVEAGLHDGCLHGYSPADVRGSQQILV